MSSVCDVFGVNKCVWVSISVCRWIFTCGWVCWWVGACVGEHMRVRVNVYVWVDACVGDCEFGSSRHVACGLASLRGCLIWLCNRCFWYKRQILLTYAGFMSKCSITFDNAEPENKNTIKTSFFGSNNFLNFKETNIFVLIDICGEL